MVSGMPHIYPKTAPSPSTICTPSNTPIPRPTPLTTSNGIQIQSAVFPKYTFGTDTDRQTDTWDKRQVHSKAAYEIVSDAAKNSTKVNMCTCRLRLAHKYLYLSRVVTSSTGFYLISYRSGHCRRRSSHRQRELKAIHSTLSTRIRS